MNPQITEQLRSKLAYVYVRQSTLAQVRHHQESTERQYALREKALELGWNDPEIHVLDRLTLNVTLTAVLGHPRSSCFQ